MQVVSGSKNCNIVTTNNNKTKTQLPVSMLNDFPIFTESTKPPSCKQWSSRAGPNSEIKRDNQGLFFGYDYFYLDTTYMKCMFTSNFTVTKPNSFIKLILNMPNTNHNLGTQIRMKFPNSPRCGMRTFFKESPSLADTKICLSLSTYT